MLPQAPVYQVRLSRTWGFRSSQMTTPKGGHGQYHTGKVQFKLYLSSSTPPPKHFNTIQGIQFITAYSQGLTLPIHHSFMGVSIIKIPWASAPHSCWDPEIRMSNRLSRPPATRSLKEPQIFNSRPLYNQGKTA